MAVKISWLYPESIILAHYQGEVIPDDIKQQYEEGLQMAELSPREMVHIIADCRDVTRFPKTLSAYNGTYGKKATNAGWIVLIGNNLFIRSFTSIISQVMKVQLAYRNSISDAIKFIASLDKNVDMTKISDLQSYDNRHSQTERMSV